ncbi:MAG TPA: hypothetical protein VFQ53_17215 [Kofleriaceae bacterium]|nr:hypothetical protein [Kofleriaceae bacterium]
MASIRSLISTRRFAELALAGTLFVVAGTLLHGERVDACAGFEPLIEDVTTFDPGVLGEDESALGYDPFVSGFGGGCGNCLTNAMLEDWAGYLKDAVKPADWSKLLLEAKPGELAAIAKRLAGASGTSPATFRDSSLWSAKGAGLDRLRAAVAVVELARKLEAFTSLEAYDEAQGKTVASPPTPKDLIAQAKAAMKATKDKFIAQRYAFLAVRGLFYAGDHAGLVGFVDGNRATLDGPSKDLAWRTRYYLAGSLIRTNARPRADVELARIHASYPPLAGLAAADFKPKGDGEWHAALKLAATPRERAEMWRLVGLSQDGLVATQEILKLDPKSNLVGLLLVRELARVESRGGSAAWEEAPSATDVAAQQKAYARLEQLAVAIADRPGSDRPWIANLVAGHVAAKRGDVATARTRLTRAVAQRPGDLRVASQAKASLAVGIVVSWRIDPQHEDELATAVGQLDPKFARLASVNHEIRTTLAKAYAKAGRIVDAEYLAAGTADETRAPNAKSPWESATFIQQMIARTARQSTPFERFVLAGGTFKREDLERELAMRYVREGKFVDAAKLFQIAHPTSARLGTDPFVIHIRDCHDCDHARYAHAAWTHASFTAKLVELERSARGGGETAAQSALLLGNALYNITHHGNARVVFEATHQATEDTAPAEYWYKRAYELTTKRELKAKAAYLAAKAELGALITKQQQAQPGDPDVDLVPVRWFKVLKGYKTTAYYREVLRECGTFATWSALNP